MTTATRKCPACGDLVNFPIDVLEDGGGSAWSAGRVAADRPAYLPASRQVAVAHDRVDDEHWFGAEQWLG
jgi:hypothetical protein